MFQDIGRKKATIIVFLLAIGMTLGYSFFSLWTFEGVFHPTGGLIFLLIPVTNEGYSPCFLWGDERARVSCCDTFFQR
ncbi:MAG TPA: hypothetical protein DCE42_01085 [Myxococcales bacterium]|nr:hypothetical protein [Deltaproteobacteria bacterium]HAA53315.1 hypothetical protein [Myxococcales bacterium]